MTAEEGAAPSPKVAAPSVETRTAAKQAGLVFEGTGEGLWRAAVFGPLVDLAGGEHTSLASVVVVIPRAQWDELIVVCTYCGHPHRHHVVPDEGWQVIRKGPGGARYLIVVPEGVRR